MSLEQRIARIRRMPYGLQGFTAFCQLLRVEDGSPLRLARFQRFLLTFYFAGVTELIIIMPKKNGKTTLMAALALYHLLMTPAAECVIAAASEKQAGILHNQAATMVYTAGLERRRVGVQDRITRYEGIFEVREEEIRFELGRIRVLPADVRTAQGVVPSLALVDEYHCHPSSGVYAIFRDGLTPRHGQMITISNPGVTFDSPLGKLREEALRHPCQNGGRRRVHESPDGSVVLVEWGLQPEDDPDDLKLVKMANPAPWQTIAELRRRRDSWSISRAEWLRHGAGLWSAGDDAAVDALTWDMSRVDIGRIQDGEQVVLVPSVGHNAAIGIVAVRPDDRVAVRAEILEPIEGTSILARCEQRIMELCERYEVLGVHHPVGGFVRSADLLGARGLPMIEAAHSPVRMTAATGTFERMLRAGALMHDGDEALRDHVLAGVRKVSENGERFVITDRARALIAVTFAVHAATAMGEPVPKIHVYQGASG